MHYFNKLCQKNERNDKYLLAEIKDEQETI